MQLERGRGFVLVTLLAEVSQYQSGPAGGALSISVSILLWLQLLLLCAVLLGGAHPLKEAQLGREEEAEWRRWGKGGGGGEGGGGGGGGGGGCRRR